MSNGSFDRNEILAAFHALSEELARRDLRAKLFVVGGAAMALAYGDRRLTRDVDAIFEPKEAVYAAARHIAKERGLPDDWLNDSVKAFVPGPDVLRRSLVSTDNLEVAVASPEYLLAMKLLASRVEQDVDDIRTLYSLVGFTTAEQGMQLVERFYPSRILEPRIRFLLEELYGDAQQ